MRKTLLAAVAALVAFAAQAATQEPMAAPTLPSPPLLPGEVLIKTANGCGQVLPQSYADASSYWAPHNWDGSCVAGLLQGQHARTEQVSDSFRVTERAQFVLGHVTSVDAQYWRPDGISHAVAIFAGDGFEIEPSGFDISQPDWTTIKLWMSWTVRDAAGSTTVALQKIDCASVSEKLHHCGRDNDRVIAVWRADKHDNRYDLCPDSESIRGCEKILASDLAGMAERISAIKASALAWNAKLNESYQRYMADYSRAQAAIAAAAAAQQREARQAEAEFQSSLKTMGAGQLFAKADELRRAGQTDKSLQMLRALVSRFPNSPLAGTAAQQLSGMSGGASSGSAPQYNGGGAAAASSGSCHAKVMEDEARVRGYNVHVDAQGRPASSILLYQYVMYVLQQRLNVLDTYCKGQPEYAQRPSAQRTYDTAAKNCAAISSTNMCPGPVMPPRM